MPEQMFQLSLAERERLTRRIATLLKEKGELERALRVERDREIAERETLYLELLDLLDMVDTLGSFLEATPEPPPAFVKRLPRTIGAIRAKLDGTLESRAVREIPSPEGTLDYALCRVVDREVRADLPDQTLLKVLKRGYRIGEKVLRPIEVVSSRQQ